MKDQHRLSNTYLNRLETSSRRTTDLKPNPRNARTHAKKQVEQIVGSIRRFGWTYPILIDEHSRICQTNSWPSSRRKRGLRRASDIPGIGAVDRSFYEPSRSRKTTGQDRAGRRDHYRDRLPRIGHTRVDHAGQVLGCSHGAVVEITRHDPIPNSCSRWHPVGPEQGASPSIATGGGSRVDRSHCQIHLRLSNHVVLDTVNPDKWT